jgi:hypothetical protein
MGATLSFVLPKRRQTKKERREKVMADGGGFSILPICRKVSQNPNLKDNIINEKRRERK